jgi:CBS domain-containing protein
LWQFRAWHAAIEAKGRNDVIRLTGTAALVLGKTRTGVVSVGPEASVLEALEVMAARNVGAVVVLDGERLTGILSERDCARKVELAGRTARDTRVAEIMTREVVTVTLSTPIATCNTLMHDHRVRHLPVMEEGRVVGVLSSRDVLEEVVAEEEKQIHDLETERLMIDTGNY